MTFARPRPAQPPKDPNAPRYVTWRYADRRYSLVHVQLPGGDVLCGRTPGRDVGRPTAPIPESALCPECLSATTPATRPR